LLDGEGDRPPPSPPGSLATSDRSPDARPPLSPRKLAANRANARNSTGPRTAAGKAASACNAYQHGLTGESLALPPDPGALPDRADKPEDSLPVVVVEPVAGRVPAAGGGVAELAVVSEGVPLEVGVRMLRCRAGCEVTRGGGGMQNSGRAEEDRATVARPGGGPYSPQAEKG
jgi:hypothetical protein